MFLKPKLSLRVNLEGLDELNAENSDFSQFLFLASKSPSGRHAACRGADNSYRNLRDLVVTRLI